MDNEIKLQSILKTVEEELKVWLMEEGQIQDPIEYEKKVLGMALRFGKSIVTESGGKQPKDRNQKKRY